MLTIVIPCSENENLVKFIIQENKEIFSKYQLIIVNKMGGEPFQQFKPLFFNQDSSFWFARRFGYEFVKTKYTLNLDVDTILPQGYVEEGIKMLESNEEISVVAIDYEEPNNQGHLAFGTSIWRTEELRHLYDWRLAQDQSGKICECLYMWNKISNRVGTLSMKAKHVKIFGD
jgi:hypothetical protein